MVTVLGEAEAPPEVTVVMPCLNEAETIGDCVGRVKEAFRRCGINGEIVVSDNGSTDGSPEIAMSNGARVVHQPERGYGNAYLAGFEAARGRYIVMGDSDGTYDFLDIDKFVRLLREDNDFVIGSRFEGQILPGAMPWLHQYIGNPALTGLLNVLFRTNISDAHSGMRAFTRDAYRRMNLQTTGMEFASEMVINACRARLKIAEVPITYYPRKGESKLRSFSDGWRHLRFMLLYSPTYLFLIPGLVLLVLGFLPLLLLLPGPLWIAGRMLDYHLMILGAMMAILGMQVLSLGLCAKVYSFAEHFTQDQFVREFLGRFTLEKGLISGSSLFAVGLLIFIYILTTWVEHGFKDLFEVRPGLLALTLTIIGVQVVFSSFFISLLALPKRH